MGSKVVVTYKRKRLFSRSGHSHIDLHSAKPSGILKSKDSTNFNKHEPVAEHLLQNKDREIGVRCRVIFQLVKIFLDTRLFHVCSWKCLTWIVL